MLRYLGAERLFSNGELKYMSIKLNSDSRTYQHMMIVKKKNNIRVETKPVYQKILNPPSIIELHQAGWKIVRVEYVKNVTIEEIPDVYLKKDTRTWWIHWTGEKFISFIYDSKLSDNSLDKMEREEFDMSKLKMEKTLDLHMLDTEYNWKKI